MFLLLKKRQPVLYVLIRFFYLLLRKIIQSYENNFFISFSWNNVHRVFVFSGFCLRGHMSDICFSVFCLWGFLLWGKGPSQKLSVSMLHFHCKWKLSLILQCVFFCYKNPPTGFYQSSTQNQFITHHGTLLEYSGGISTRTRRDLRCGKNQVRKLKNFYLELFWCLSSNLFELYKRGKIQNVQRILQ